jgi:hypothetical protein
MARVLVVTYDVSDLTAFEIRALEMEAAVQAESSDEHPSVNVTTEIKEQS